MLSSMFKIAHLSDVHAGYTSTRKVNAQGINLREADGYIALKRMITDVIEHEVDAVVVPGDTFHTPTPNMRSIQFVQRQFWRLWQASIPVYILSGNHDVSDLRAEISASRILDDPWKKIYSHAEPYAHHKIADGINLHMVSHHMYGEQKDTMSQVKPVDGEINIFATHGSVIDPILEYKLHTEHSPREIVIPDELLADGWDYMMLGHIHERGWVGSTDKKTDTAESRIYYNGSLIRRGFSDKDVPLGRGWTLWEIDTDGTFKAYPKTVQQRPQYDFDIIDAIDLSSSDLTDVILANLKSTQIDGSTEFDSHTAPIVRQKIVNLSSSKYAGLDYKIIDQNTQHTMLWDLKHSPHEEARTSGSTIIEHGEIAGSTDVLKAYDDWAERSTTLKNLSDDFRDKVLLDAKNFVKSGQEAMLDSDEE